MTTELLFFPNVSGGGGSRESWTCSHMHVPPKNFDKRHVCSGSEISFLSSVQRDFCKPTKNFHDICGTKKIILIKGQTENDYTN